jgi:hypothetical protein
MFDHYNSDKYPLQADPLLTWLHVLPSQQNPNQFLDRVTKALNVVRQIRQDEAEAQRQAKAEAEVQRQAKARFEATAKIKLIAILLEYAKRQGIGINDLPYLKGMSYKDLCLYIDREWTELKAYI